MSIKINQSARATALGIISNSYTVECEVTRYAPWAATSVVVDLADVLVRMEGRGDMLAEQATHRAESAVISDGEMGGN